ncbi:hypothetical protein Cni_G02378 [Canna indica]|uniref:Uncharacterized protein n=1 Tax=Canna indica TaxID=4628 RepID=A0AAQ3JPC5_9LILI|nr:hypothetical protein Cni_G02378 [Canna indica]
MQLQLLPLPLPLQFAMVGFGDGVRVCVCTLQACIRLPVLSAKETSSDMLKLTLFLDARPVVLRLSR